MAHDFTKGPIFKPLILFTIPLILGTVLQLTYNAVDSMIVGLYVGKTALAAVGTTNPIVTLVLLFTNGICLGAGILVSNMYGAKETALLKRQVSTGMISGIVFSMLVAFLMILLARPILLLLQVEDVFLNEAIAYFRLILLGLVFSFVYNYLASMLRAMGDSTSPLIFLAISAFLNIFGDLFFIIFLGLGVSGAAISTVLSEFLSALLCLLYIQKKIPDLRLGRGWLVFDRALLKKTVSYGFVSAMQQSTVQMGKLGTQAIVNTMGVNQTAAFNAVNRFDDFSMVPEQNIAHATTSVMAQNKGAGNKDRLLTTFRIGILCELIYGIAIGLITFLGAGFFMKFFTSDVEVIREGVKYLSLIAFMYVFPGMTNGIQGYFRGIGDLRITLWSSMINMGVRVFCEIPMVFYFGLGFEAIPWSYLLGWIAMTAFELPFLIRSLSGSRNS